jgi:hypothetical protein
MLSIHGVGSGLSVCLSVGRGMRTSSWLVPLILDLHEISSWSPSLSSYPPSSSFASSSSPMSSSSSSTPARPPSLMLKPKSRGQDCLLWWISFFPCGQPAMLIGILGKVLIIRLGRVLIGGQSVAADPCSVDIRVRVFNGSNLELGTLQGCR